MTRKVVLWTFLILVKLMKICRIFSTNLQNKVKIKAFLHSKIRIYKYSRYTFWRNFNIQLPKISLCSTSMIFQINLAHFIQKNLYNFYSQMPIVKKFNIEKLLCFHIPWPGLLVIANCCLITLVYFFNSYSRLPKY